VVPQKTYWHLLHNQRVPSEYELGSASLLYYVGRGFEIDLPLAEWYRRYQQGSPFSCTNWEQFSDPRKTTYASYTALQSSQEVYVDGLLESIEASTYDRALGQDWIGILNRALGPLRYAVHALQMVACYVGQMAPSGRITIAAMFQAADEMRRVQRLAYRMCQLQLAHPGFGEDSRARWQEDPVWQPLREACERLLVTYDWGESFTALNLVLKPMLDELFMTHFGHLAHDVGDYLLQQIFQALEHDCRWHRRWSEALASLAVRDTPANDAVIRGWVVKWYPLAERAVNGFAPLFEDILEESKSGRFAAAKACIVASLDDYLRQAGVENALPEMPIVDDQTMPASKD